MALADPGTPPLSRPTLTLTTIDIDNFNFFDDDNFVLVEGVVFVVVIVVWTTLWSCSAPADPRQEGRVYFSFP